MDFEIKLENLRKNEKELINQIIGWISKRKISIIPAPFDLGNFHPIVFSVDQSKMLIQKGFNPKTELYRCDEQLRAKYISDLTNRLGKDFTKLNNNFWFCLKTSECDKNCSKGCHDQTDRFRYTKGIRTPKNVKLGEGGFGKVFLGNIHGEKVGTKYIDVTKEVVGCEATRRINKILLRLFGNIAFEAIVQSGFGHPNILKVRDWWIQCSGLNVGRAAK